MRGAALSPPKATKSLFLPCQLASALSFLQHTNLKTKVMLLHCMQIRHVGEHVAARNAHDNHKDERWER